MNSLLFRNVRIVASYGIMLFFTYLMWLITLQYIPAKIDTAFLKIKEEIAVHRYYQVAFFTHVYTSFIVLILGLPQFLAFVRTKWPITHKWLGKAYVAIILFLSAPTGLIMGYHANGGISSKISFILQGLLWIYFTAQAYRYAIQKDWEKHWQFMCRSFALTLS